MKAHIKFLSQFIRRYLRWIGIRERQLRCERHPQWRSDGKRSTRLLSIDTDREDIDSDRRSNERSHGLLCEVPPRHREAQSSPHVSDNE